MIPIRQSTRNLKWINSLSSKLLLNRTGSFSSNTTSGSMAGRLNLSSAAMAKPFPKIPSVHYAAPLTISSMTTMGAMGSISAKSVGRPSVLVNSLQHHSGLSALTVGIPLPPRKTGNFSAYINASTKSVLTISTTFPKWIQKTWKQTLAKTNINSTTSTVNSLWISLP